MSELTPTYSVSVDAERRELHFATSGLFDKSTMRAFNEEIARAVSPILAQKRRMRALGDLTGYVVQTREISSKMAETLAAAEAVGIERVAIIMTSALVRMQYQRISEGRNVKIFDNREDALAWLRADQVTA